MSNAEVLFRVVFNGRTTGEYDLDTTKRQFRDLLQLDDRKVARAFAAAEVIIKERVSEPVAIDYAIKLAEAGCECYIEEILEPIDPTLDPNFVDRRVANRRVYTAADVMPNGERRTNFGRRKTDLPANASQP